MSPRQRLHPEERTFFVALADTVFSNPFDDHGRPGLLDRLGAPAATTPAHRYQSLLVPLTERLADLAARGVTGLAAVHPDDEPLLRAGYLFRSYQKNLPALGELIDRQLVLGAQPAPVPFAGGLLAELQGVGMTPAESQRMLALFYQLRRAFHFIELALVGTSAAMRRLRAALWGSVFTQDVRVYADSLWNRMEDFSTLLLGETGTGKGSAAAAIGRSGMIPFDPRLNRFAVSFTETFIATNLSQFPEGLIESELFGHRKGAFTGAVEDHQGLFEHCHAHGSLFLDEIGELAVPIQIKLLNVLQERTFTPVGSHVRKRFQGRVIAATNRSLEELRGGGRFRDDFFYRLSSHVITVPPLRERLRESPEELRCLVEVLLARMTGEAAGRLMEPIMEALGRLPAGYPWPGNVRELEQALRRILLNGEYIPDPLPPRGAADPWLSELQAGRLDARGVVGGYCRRLYLRLGSYEAVAQVVGLDRRTVKKYVDGG